MRFAHRKDKPLPSSADARRGGVSGTTDYGVFSAIYQKGDSGRSMQDGFVCTYTGKPIEAGNKGKIEPVPFEERNRLSETDRVIAKTGECTFFANVIRISYVGFSL
jgi:hypothetical protein